MNASRLSPATRSRYRRRCRDGQHAGPEASLRTNRPRSGSRPASASYEGLVYRSKYLSAQDVSGNDRQIDCDLENLFQIIAARYFLICEGFFDARSITIRVARMTLLVVPNRSVQGSKPNHRCATKNWSLRGDAAQIWTGKLIIRVIIAKGAQPVRTHEGRKPPLRFHRIVSGLSAGRMGKWLRGPNHHYCARYPVCA